MTCGDKFWYVARNLRYSERGYEVEVVKVGRKWVYLSNDKRVEKGETWVDGAGYSSPGRLWESEAAWRESVEVSSLLRKIQDRCQYGRAGDVSLDDARTAAGLLGVPL